MRQLTTSEFLAKKFDRRYLVEPLLPAGGIGIVHGKGGHGKTQLAFTLIREMLRGGQLFDRYGCAQGRVLFFQFDMPEELFQERLARVAPLYEYPDNLRIITQDKTIDVLQKNTAEWIAEEVQEAEPALVIFDTLRKLHTFDENDNAVPSQLYGVLKEACGKAGILVLHHDRKTSALNDDEDGSESFRGARAWVDDSDLGIRIRKRGERLMVDWSKLRCAEQDKIMLEMNQDTLLLQLRAPITAKEWAMRVLAENPKIPKVDLVKEIMERGAVGQTAAYKAVHALEEGR